MKTSRAQLLWSSDDGFTIVESLVTMMLVVIIFTGATASIASTLDVLEINRRFAQATGLGNAVIEEARDLRFDDLIMSDSDSTVAADPLITGTGELVFDPDGGDSLAAEKLVISASGGTIDPHTATRTIDNTDYTVHRYVTWVDDTTQGGPDDDYKRYTAVITWDIGGRTYTYQTSTFFSAARRGLPTPSFDIIPETQSATAEPDAQVVFTHGVRNTGIVDTYDISVETPLGRLWTPTYYLDVDQNLTFDPTDPLLLDTNGNLTLDTGSVATDETTFFHVVWTLNGATELPGTEEIKVIVTSGADPSVNATATDTLTIGAAGIVLYLHNNPSPPTGDTTSQTNLDMDITVPTEETLYNYSTDSDTDPGRSLDKGGSTNESTNGKMVNWLYQAPEELTLSGSVQVDLYYANKDFLCDKHLDVVVHLRQKNSANTPNGTVLGTGTGTWNPDVTCSFTMLSITFPVSAIIPNNKWLEIKVLLDPSIGGDAGYLAYDTATYQSFAIIPTSLSS